MAETMLDITLDVRGLAWCYLRLRAIAFLARVLHKAPGPWHVRFRMLLKRDVMKVRAKLGRGRLPATVDGFDVPFPVRPARRISLRGRDLYRDMTTQSGEHALGREMGRETRGA